MNVNTAERVRGQRKKMNIFTIDEDNNITAYAGAKEAAQAGDATATTFDSPATLAKISAGWPLSRFVEIWNSVPGNTGGEEVRGPPEGGAANLERDSILSGRRAAERRRSKTGEACRKRPGNEEGQSREEGQGYNKDLCRQEGRRPRWAQQQEGGSDRDDETSQGRDIGANHGNDGLAGAHCARFREPVGQQRRGEDHILAEQRRREDVSHRKIGFYRDTETPPRSSVVRQE